MNKKILIVIIIVIAAVVIPFGIYTISPLFISNTLNEPLPVTVATANKNVASQDYQNSFQKMIKIDLMLHNI